MRPGSTSVTASREGNLLPKRWGRLQPGPSHTVPERGERGGPGDSSQVLPRIQNSSGNFVLIRQLQNQAGKSISWSESGSVMIARVGYSPAIAEQVHKDKAGLGSSWEVSLLVRICIKRVCGWAQARLWLSWRLVLLQHSSGKH